MGVINDVCRRLHQLLVLLDDIQHGAEPSTIEQHLARKDKAQLLLREWTLITQPILQILTAQRAWCLMTIQYEGMDAAQTEYGRAIQCYTMVTHLRQEIE